MNPEEIASIPRSNNLEYQIEVLNKYRVARETDEPIIARCLKETSLHGTFVDSRDSPGWARKIAQFAFARLREQARCVFQAEDAIAPELRGKGKGQRAVWFQLAMKLDPNIFKGAQTRNNCCPWCYREVAGCCIAVDVIEKREPHLYEARPGTAGIYAYRGTISDNGMAMSEGAEAVHLRGITLEKNYPNVADLSTQSKDEEAGVRWGRGGPPQALRELVKNDLIEQVSNVQEEEAVKDILFGGHFIATGSTRTADADGDPISPIGRIGGHAQAMIGYDDTDEFRDWYMQTTGRKLTDWVGIFDQSWGPNWIDVENWPTHLWGPRPEGSFVLRGSDAMQLITIWGEAIACSSVSGFPLRVLPDWGSYAYL